MRRLVSAGHVDIDITAFRAIVGRMWWDKLCSYRAYIRYRMKESSATLLLHKNIRSVFDIAPANCCVAGIAGDGGSSAYDRPPLVSRDEEARLHEVHRKKRGSTDVERPYHRSGGERVRAMSTSGTPSPPNDHHSDTNRSSNTKFRNKKANRPGRRPAGGPILVLSAPISPS